MKKAIVAYFKELHRTPGATEKEHEKVLFMSIVLGTSWAYIFIGMYTYSVIWKMCIYIS